MSSHDQPTDPRSADAVCASADLERSRAETRASFQNRALMYAYIYDELEAEIGAEAATALMKRAIHRRGVEVGERYQDAVAARDLDEVARIFVETSPCAGALFEPGVEQQPSSGSVVLRMTGCPLADAWRDAGYAPDKVDHLCDIAAAVDFGTFEGAGLDLRFLDRQACPGSEKCLLEIKLRS